MKQNAKPGLKTTSIRMVTSVVTETSWTPECGATESELNCDVCDDKSSQDVVWTCVCDYKN